MNERFAAMPRVIFWATLCTVIFAAYSADLPAQSAANSAAPPLSRLGSDAPQHAEKTPADAAGSITPNLTPLPDNKNPITPTSPFGWVGALLLVLGLFMLAAWMIRRASPRMHRALPSEVFEMLGHAPLGNRQQAQLLRCGNKLILLAASLNGLEPLTEITDPAEVERLTALCRQTKPTAPASSLFQIFFKKERHDG
jgi:flagellar protein FliO/FliZ